MRLKLLVVMAFSAAVVAQSAGLSDADKADAVVQGAKLKGKPAGLFLQDSGQAFMKALNSVDRSGDKGGTNTGFSLRVYTPKAWVMQLASDAAKEYRPFTVADVPALDPVLRVVVYPDKPTFVVASGLRHTSSVQHVILRDLAKTSVVQPTFKEPFTDTVANAVGGTATYDGLRVQFPMDAVRELRGAKNAGFYIVVIGTEGSKERTFEVKQKHFIDLP